MTTEATLLQTTAPGGGDSFYDNYNQIWPADVKDTSVSRKLSLEQGSRTW